MVKRTENKSAETMPTIDKYSSRAHWEAACWKRLLKSNTSLQLLVTSHERHILVMRAIAIDRIIAGKSYSQIAKELWLSPQTVSGIKKSLKENSYQSYLQRSKKERKKRAHSSHPLTRRSKPNGRPRRTKFGTVYLPY